jgi:hypothetical protein
VSFCFFAFFRSGFFGAPSARRKNQINPHVVSLGFFAFLDVELHQVVCEKAKKQINTKNVHWTSTQPKHLGDLLFCFFRPWALRGGWAWN